MLFNSYTKGEAAAFAHVTIRMIDYWRELGLLQTRRGPNYLKKRRKVGWNQRWYRYSRTDVFYACLIGSLKKHYSLRKIREMWPDIRQAFIGLHAKTALPYKEMRLVVCFRPRLIIVGSGDMAVVTQAVPRRPNSLKRPGNYPPVPLVHVTFKEACTLLLEPARADDA